MNAHFKSSLAMTSFYAECTASVVRAVSVLFQKINYHELKHFRSACLWCLITSSSLKEPLAQRGRFPERSLVSLTSDWSSFLSSGGDVRNAKHHNIIVKYFFDIPLENVRKYAVNRIRAHLLTVVYCMCRFVFQDYTSNLASTTALWTFLEEACTELDLKLAKVKQGEDGIGGTTFVQYSVVIKQRSSLKAQQ